MKVQMISAKGSRKGKPFYTNRRYANALSRLGLATYADAADVPAETMPVQAAPEPDPVAVVPAVDESAVAEVAEEAPAALTEDDEEKPRRKYKTRRIKAEE